MRRLASAVTALVVLGSSAAPALATLACAAPHACCAKDGTHSAPLRLEAARRPCCARSSPLRPVAQNAVAPSHCAAGAPVAPAPSFPPRLDAPRVSRAPAAFTARLPPPVGPPLRLRI